jgi:hypothetical protein
MKTASSKAKGRRAQDWVADKIGELLNLPVGRDQSIAPREMGQNGTDVRLIGEALKSFPYSIEIKNQEKWSIISWIKQAKTNLIKDTNWLLFCKKNRHEMVVVLDANHFFEIMARLKHAEQNSNRKLSKS